MVQKISLVFLMGSVNVKLVMVALGAVNVHMAFIVHHLTNTVQVFDILVITLISVLLIIEH